MLNATPFVNRSACKKAILEIASKNRSHKFTRVGADVMEHLNDMLYNSMKNLVHSHPSVGKTIMMGTKKRKQDEPSE